MSLICRGEYSAIYTALEENKIYCTRGEYSRKSVQMKLGSYVKYILGRIKLYMAKCVNI